MHMGRLRIEAENGKVCVGNLDLRYWFQDDGRQRTMLMSVFRESVNADGCFTFPSGDSFTVTAWNKRNRIIGCDRHGEVFMDEENRGFRKRDKSLKDARGRILARHYSRRIEEANGGPISYGDGCISFEDWMLYEFSMDGVIGTLVLDEKWEGHDLLLAFPDELWQIYRVQVMARYNLRNLPYP